MRSAESVAKWCRLLDAEDAFCSASRVLVVAPHPDDDVIGCGGLLHRLARRGASVTVVYVTDGRASHPSSRRVTPEQLASLREREALTALAELGVTDVPTFLRIGDGTLANIREEDGGRIVAALCDAASRTDIVLGPWRRDPHPDHIATASFLAQAIRHLAARPRVYEYFVWARVRGDAPPENGRDTPLLEVHLTPTELRAKRHALLAHASQTTGLIGDDPQGFRIDAELMERWLTPCERFLSCHDERR